jgi:TctA family transporter
MAWRRSAALLQAREEEEEDRGEERRSEEKRREILIGADQDQDLFFYVVTLSCFQTRSYVFGFLSLALLRKPNREAKA